MWTRGAKGEKSPFSKLSEYVWTGLTDVCIEELCSHKVRDFSSAFREGNVFGTFEERWLLPQLS